MDVDTTENLMSYLEQIDCPFTCDIDASYLSRLLLTPSRHRMRILSWLLSRVDEDIEREIELFNRDADTFKGLKEIDGEVQLLTDIASSIGLCLDTDFHLIRGKASPETHISFWRNLLAIVSSISDTKKESLSDRAVILQQTMESIFRVCDISAALSSTSCVLPPAIAKELEILQKTSKFSNACAPSTVESLSDKLEMLQIELDKQLSLLQNLKTTNPTLSVTSDDDSLIETLNRTLGVTLNDLTQLQTSFLQTFQDHFQPYCDKEHIKFTKLGSVIHDVDNQLSSLLKFLECMKTLKSCHQKLVESNVDCKS